MISDGPLSSACLFTRTGEPGRIVEYRIPNGDLSKAKVSEHMMVISEVPENTHDESACL